MEVKIDHAGAAPAEAPSAAAPSVFDPSVSAILTDARGRKLLLRSPSWLERTRFRRACGPQWASVESAVMEAMPAICVREIDGVPVAFPRTEREIEALLIRLGDDVVLTIGQWAKQQQDALEQALADGQAAGAGGDKDTVKNS